MTDERIDALIRRLDVHAEPDAGFVGSSTSMLLGRVRATRVQDASRFGRMRRDLRLALDPGLWSRVPQPLAVVGLLCLVLLGALIAALVIGGLLTPKPIPRNGPLILSVGGQLRAIDVDSGRDQPDRRGRRVAVHVSRSPDGATLAFWRPDPGWRSAHVHGSANTPARPRTRTWQSNGEAASTRGRPIPAGWPVRSHAGRRSQSAPPGRLQHRYRPPHHPEGCDRPLPTLVARWGVDRLHPRLQFGTRSLAVIRSRWVCHAGDQSVGLGGLDVSGPDTWSPDGAWIYFDATGSGVGRVFRANVAEGRSTALTDPSLLAVAPASSPTVVDRVHRLPTRRLGARMRRTAMERMRIESPNTRRTWAGPPTAATSSLVDPAGPGWRPCHRVTGRIGIPGHRSADPACRMRRGHATWVGGRLGPSLEAYPIIHTPPSGSPRKDCRPRQSR